MATIRATRPILGAVLGTLGIHLWPAWGELQPEAGSVLEALGSYWEHWESRQDLDLTVGHAGVALRALGHTGILPGELWLTSIVLGVLVVCWKHWAHTGIVPEDLWCRPVLFWEHWDGAGCAHTARFCHISPFYCASFPILTVFLTTSCPFVPCFCPFPSFFHTFFPTFAVCCCSQ